MYFQNIFKQAAALVLKREKDERPRDVVQESSNERRYLGSVSFNHKTKKYPISKKVSGSWEGTVTSIHEDEGDSKGPRYHVEFDKITVN